MKEANGAGEDEYPEAKLNAYVFYHYFPPDDVVSAVHFGELCSELAQRGWSITSFPSVWSCRNGSQRFPRTEHWRRICIRRIWRPQFRQSSFIGRILNACWMITRWSLMAFDRKAKPAVLIIGTDPIMSVIVARIWRRFKSETKIAHWCFDLYPEAAIADGVFAKQSRTARFLTKCLLPAYRACSLIVDIGPSMRKLLEEYPSDAVRKTIVPWAMYEPALPMPTDVEERAYVFGSARLGLLYSGSFGRAHSYQDLLKLADLIVSDEIKMAFSIRGNRETELRSAAKCNQGAVRFVPFADSDKLDARLACADVHIVTLRPEWTGTVVPSKFFGALAVGRPVLFCGSPSCSISEWISIHKIGWVLNSDNVDRVARALRQYAVSREAQKTMQERCIAIYQREFSREVQIDRWDRALRSVLAGSRESDSQ